MMLVQPGDVVFHVGRGLLSAGIRRVTGCPFSHVSLVIEVRGQDFTVLDVVGRRIIQSIQAHDGDHTWHVRAPRYADPDGSQWMHSEVPTATARIHVVRHALELHESLRKGYPWMELTAYLPLFRRTRWGRHILRRTERLVCSAMVAAAWHSMGFRWYQEAAPGTGLHGLIEISPDWVDPGTMWRQAARDHWPIVCTKESHNAER